MPIPSFNGAGLLPPYVGDPTRSQNHSPYHASMVEVAQRFCATAERQQLFRNFLAYRAELAAIGINRGFQWVDGSFSEDIEAIENRPPGDVDIVTFFYRPTFVRSQAEWDNLVNANAGLFDVAAMKHIFKCHTFYVDLDLAALGQQEWVVEATRFYNSLFSHKRVTGRWKGMVRVDLNTADDPAAAALVP